MQNVRQRFLRSWFIGIALGLVLIGETRAEKYLTVEQAQKICFPQADEFQAKVWKFTAEQMKAIEKHSGIKVQNRGNRVWLAQAKGRYLGVLVLDSVIGKHELIDYVVAISPSGQTQQVEIVEYRESHGREIRSPKWRAQFEGKTAESPLKLNEDIYNISGATISCRQVTQGIKRVLATYEVVGRAQLLASGQLPHSN